MTTEVDDQAEGERRREALKRFANYELEVRNDSTRRRVTQVIWDAHLGPDDSPRLEKWKQERKPIGEGGQGKVYVQRCTTAGTSRAVKMIRHNSGRPRCVQELEMMIQFSHQKHSRWFVRMLGWYVLSESTCIVMEYFPLGDMHTFMRERSPLEESDARTVVSQVLRGLSVMHEAGFAHRDVKPQNILIQRKPSSLSQGSWWVKLADFGISKDVNRMVTSHTDMLGTWEFRAPELLSYGVDPSTIDYTASDVWSAGATAFYLLTKRRREDSRGFGNLEEVAANLSTGARDFLQKILVPVPQLRLNAGDSLAHAWIKDGMPSGQRTATLETE